MYNFFMIFIAYKILCENEKLVEGKFDSLNTMKIVYVPMSYTRTLFYPSFI